MKYSLLTFLIGSSGGSELFLQDYTNMVTINKLNPTCTVTYGSVGYDLQPFDKFSRDAKAKEAVSVDIEGNDLSFVYKLCQPGFTAPKEGEACAKKAEGFLIQGEECVASFGYSKFTPTETEGGIVGSIENFKLKFTSETKKAGFCDEEDFVVNVDATCGEEEAGNFETKAISECSADLAVTTKAACVK